jgi:WD40 repeat protein
MLHRQAPSVAEQLQDRSNIMLERIKQQNFNTDNLPTHCTLSLHCGNDVFDVIVLDKRTVATSHKQKPEILIWDITTLLLLYSINIKTTQNWEMMRIDEERLLIGSFMSKSLHLINWRTCEILQVINLGASIMYYGHRVMKNFGTNQDLIIVGLESNKVAIFDLGGNFVTNFTGHTRGITCVEIIPQGRVVTGSWDTTLKLWDVSSSSCKATFVGHTGPITSICLLNEEMLISGSYDYNIKLWNIESGTCISTIGTCSDWIREIIVLSPTLICSASDDKKVRIWSVYEGKCEKVLLGHAGCVFSIAVMEDNSLISASADGCIKIWS